MKAAKSVYEGINSELKEELPVLYDRSGIVDFFPFKFCVCLGSMSRVHVFLLLAV